MSLSDDLRSYVSTAFRAVWKTRARHVVPTPENLSLSNEAVEFERATVLYADLSGSTQMVESKDWEFAAEVYKNFLYCAAKLITAEGGAVTAYDGDRVMGVFAGKSQTTPAARCALKINYVVNSLIQPALEKQYPNKSIGFRIKQIVGIDTSSIRVARTGVRGTNDLVWVGEAANLAAKLTELESGRSWITGRAYGWLLDDAKFGGSPRQAMWEERSWRSHNGMSIYRSNWSWAI